MTTQQCVLSQLQFVHFLAFLRAGLDPNMIELQDSQAPNLHHSQLESEIPTAYNNRDLVSQKRQQRDQ